MKARSLRLCLLPLWLICALGAVAMVTNTLENGGDFGVFWSAGRHLLAGEPLYSVGRDGMQSFKYPPWSAPFFVPISLLPQAPARLLWGALQALCVLHLARWCVLRGGCRREVVLVGVVAFWGIWCVHALDGQASLMMAVAGLWGRDRFAGPMKRAALGGFAMLLALSLKVFHLFSLIGIPWRELRRGFGLKRSAALGALFLALSLPALRVAEDKTPRGLLREWAAAASSGGSSIPGQQVRNRENQGLPALVLRALAVPAEDARADLWAFLFCAIACGTAYRAFVGASGSKVPARSRWVIALALGTAAHPLAWFHLFVFAFPLAAFALDRALRCYRRRNARTSRSASLLLGLAVLGAGMIAAVTEKTLGRVGYALERASVKSLGVLVCAAVLVACSRRLPDGGGPREAR